MIVHLGLSDFYPGIQSDPKLVKEESGNLRISESKKRLDKEKQFEKMATAQRIIKKYAQHDEAERVRRKRLDAS